MYFRKLLIELHKLENKELIEEFNSTFIAFHLKKPIKEVSNDLKRVHQMGFLKRKRKKRRCLSKTGKICFKGYEYSYSFSNQGRSYLKWMRVQKPLEDLASVNHAKEILSHLPQEFKARILAQAAIRSIYRYKGPSRQLRLIDDEAIPIAISLVENQKLIDENFKQYKEILSLTTENHNLKEKINNQNEINKQYKDELINVTERIDQNELENRESVKIFLDFLKKVLEQNLWKNQINGKFMLLLKNMMSIYRKSRNRAFNALILALPEEKLDKVMNHFIRLEEAEWAEFKQKINVLNVEIQRK